MIKGGWIIAFDGMQHRLIENGVVAYENDRIVHVGKRSIDDDFEQIVNAEGKLVSPGLINCHTHLLYEAGGRYTPDVGRTDLFGNTYFNYQLPLPGATGFYEGECADIGGRYAAACVLRSGATTVVDSGAVVEDPDRLVDVLGEMGMRAYVGLGFRSANTLADKKGRIVFDWNEKRGLTALAAAGSFIQRHHGRYDGRIQGMLFPWQADTCSKKLLRAARATAEELGVRIQIHTAQNGREFKEILWRNRRTPVEFLADAGLLGPDTSLAHAIFVSGHSWAAHPFGDDLKLIADSGTSVAHCPVVFARRGLSLESFQRYLDAGINMTIGTDTYPNDVLEEMRTAYVTAKLADRSFSVASSGDIFNAATLGGAKFLGRDDLGRIAPGAKADIIVIDLKKLHFGPIRDPLKALLTMASGRDVEYVIVDGRTLVQDGRIRGLDESALLNKVQKSAEKSWSMTAQVNWEGKDLEEISPLTFLPWDRN